MSVKQFSRMVLLYEVPNLLLIIKNVSSRSSYLKIFNSHFHFDVDQYWFIISILIHSGGEYEIPQMARPWGWSCSSGTHSLVRGPGTGAAVTQSTNSWSSEERAVDTQWERTSSCLRSRGEMPPENTILLVCVVRFFSLLSLGRTHTHKAAFPGRESCWGGAGNWSL